MKPRKCRLLTFQNLHHNLDIRTRDSIAVILPFKVEKTENTDMNTPHTMYLTV